MIIKFGSECPNVYHVMLEGAECSWTMAATNIFQAKARFMEAISDMFDNEVNRNFASHIEQMNMQDN